MDAYEDTLARTSTEARAVVRIPADQKWFMRATVAEIVVRPRSRRMARASRCPAYEERTGMEEAVKRLQFASR